MKDMLLANGLWPTEGHPDTGEPFVECVKFDRQTDHQTHHYLPPGYPDREIYTFDDDGPVYVRDRTDEEFAAAVESWKKADAEWKRTGGMFVTEGQTHTTGTFKTESGAEATGQSDGKRWFWTSASWNETKQKPPGPRERDQGA